MSRRVLPRKIVKASTGAKRGRTAAWFYVFLAGVFFVIMLFEAWLARRPLAESTQSDLTEFDKKQIETFVDTNKLLTTLATALIGAITGFLINRDQKVKLSPADFRRAIASWSAAAISLYFGHLANRELLWMLRSRFFDIFYDVVWWPSRIQFWSFLLAGIFLAEFVYRSFWDREGRHET